MAASYELTVTEKGTYLHVVVTGPNNEENVLGYLAEIRRECITRDCFQVLIEERLEGPRLDTMEVFRIASRGGSRAQRFTAIAYVDVNAEGNLMKFAETVAINRGVPVAVFSSVDKAEKWLLAGQSEGQRDVTETKRPPD